MTGICAVYKVAYQILGRGQKPIGVVHDVLALGIDVSDVIDHLKDCNLGVEVVMTGKDGSIHDVVEGINLLSIELAGEVQCITSKVLNIVENLIAENLED